MDEDSMMETTYSLVHNQQGSWHGTGQASMSARAGRPKASTPHVQQRSDRIAHAAAYAPGCRTSSRHSTRVPWGQTACLATLACCTAWCGSLEAR